MPLTAKQEANLPPALKKAILAKQAKSKDDNKKNEKKPKKEGKMYK
jgi:hypothetical protein